MQRERQPHFTFSILKSNICSAKITIRVDLAIVYDDYLPFIIIVYIVDGVESLYYCDLVARAKFQNSTQKVRSEEKAS